MYFNIATRLLCRGIDSGTSYNFRGSPKCGTALETIALETSSLGSNVSNVSNVSESKLG
jgi:hypothetical protein